MIDFRKLVKQVIIYGSGVWAGKVIGFLMIPIYTRVLTPADYGVLEIISRTTDIVAVLLGMGLASALFRFHADAKSEQEQVRTASTAILFAGTMGFLLSLCLALVSESLSRYIVGSAEYAYYLRLALVATGLELATMVPLSLLRIQERPTVFTVVNMGRLLLSLGLNIYLVVMLRLGVAGILISNLTSVSVLLLALFALTRRFWRPPIDVGILKGMLAYSLPFVPSSLAMFVLNFGDRYFLRSYCSLTALGVYSLGYKLCLVMPSLVMQPLGLAWSAVMFPLAQRPDANNIYTRYFNAYMFFVVFFSLGLAVLSKDIVRLAAAKEYVSAYKIVPAVLLGFIAWAASNVLELGVLVERKSYYRSLSTIIAAVVATISYLILIPRYAGMGAAWATFASFFAMAVSTYVFSNRVHPVPYDLHRSALLIALAAIFYFLGCMPPGYGSYISALARVGIICVFPVAVYMTGYFEKQDLMAAKDIAKSVLRRVGLVPGRALLGGG